VRKNQKLKANQRRPINDLPLKGQEGQKVSDITKHTKYSLENNEKIKRYNPQGLKS